NRNILSRCFAGLDSAVRSVIFWTYAHQSLGAKILRRLLWTLRVPVRQWVRSRQPGYDFPDGYLERDIRFRGYLVRPPRSPLTFEYHLVNIHDLVKFAIQARESGLLTDHELLDRCLELTDRGIDYAVRSNYWCYLVASMRQSGAAIFLCEAIL